MNIYVTLKDTLTGATDTRLMKYELNEVEKFKLEFKEYKKRIGTFVNWFDTKQQINYTFEVIKVSLEPE